jgi:hypothetical protein
MARIVDLSAPIASSPPGTLDFQRNDVQYFDHAAGAAEVEALYGVPARLLRDGEGWARELVTLGTHNSTHVEAPRRRPSTSFRSSASSGRASCSTSPIARTARR